LNNKCFVLNIIKNFNFQGFEEREVTCVSSVSGKQVDETHCVVHEEKPNSRRSCESHKSCKPVATWRTGSWGEVRTYFSVIVFVWIHLITINYNTSNLKCQDYLKLNIQVVTIVF